MPRTDFPMKANLPVREKEIIQLWEEKNLYNKMLGKNRGATPFILHDGPPYANGNIHMGHALNKVLKDIIVKYKSLAGYFVPFVPGWDCHGLPIELKVEEQKGREARADIIAFRKACRKYAEKYVNVQREEFIRLGVFGSWSQPYLTMEYSYEADILREFATLVEKGYVYRRRRPVYWCPSCTTALAEAEVEYSEKASPSVYVAFRAAEDLREKFRLPPEASVVIWTTTPWTIPGNLGIQVHPEFDYVWVETEKGIFMIAEKRLEEFLKDTGLENKRILTRFKGAEVENLHAHHPLFDRMSLIMLSEFVTLEQGTGCVHTAPGHGEEDYEVGLRYHLDVFSPVDENGCFTAEAGEFKGEFVFDANAHVTEVLRAKGLLLAEGQIRHSYPHCWRCKKPIIFRATEQWFVSVEHEYLRQRLLSEIERVEWIPRWGRNRIASMVESRPDWCISRQRAWGVPIALFQCRGCGEYVMDAQIIRKVARAFDENGADVWYQADVRDLAGDLQCPHCGGHEFRKETDILDVWFDSGVSHAAVLERIEALNWPADLYLEGSDQHRGWFQSSLITAVTTRGHAPYRAVLTHGFVVDGEGRKMSKSLGNVISPQEIIKQHGAEIIRLWVSCEDYREDIRLSHEILQRLIEAYRKMRNTFRFMLGNLGDFMPNQMVSESNMRPLDRFAILKLNELIERVRQYYERYEFHGVYHSVYAFIVTFLSAFYLDVLKDTLYCEASDSPKRRSAQSAIYLILKNLLVILSPVMSFTCEEAWQHLRKIDNSLPESVFLNPFPESKKRTLQEDTLFSEMSLLLEVREDVLKKLEEKRVEKVIGGSLEASVTIKAPEKVLDVLNKYSDLLQEIFITSGVTVQPLEGGEKPAGERVTVYVERAKGHKCARCWMYSESVGSFKDYPDLCQRCREVIARA